MGTSIFKALEAGRAPPSQDARSRAPKRTRTEGTGSEGESALGGVATLAMYQGQPQETEGADCILGQKFVLGL